MTASSRRMFCSGKPARGAAFRSADEEINQRPKKMQEQDYQHPGDLLAVGQTAVGDCMDQHPNPKGEQKKAKWNQNQTESQSNQIKQSKHIYPFIYPPPRVCPSPCAARAR